MSKVLLGPTLESEINVGVRLLFLKEKNEKKKLKIDRNALIDVNLN